MNTPGEWDKRASAERGEMQHPSTMFQLLFERSADAILLFDPAVGTFVDCNEAAVELMRADSKAKLLGARPDQLSPAIQPDGVTSREKSAEIVRLVDKHGGHRFEWIGRRFDGSEIPLEVVATAVRVDGRNLNVSVCRDISERRKAERELLELNQSLERRVAERTAALTTSEAQFRALVEHASEAIVVFNGDTGRFLFGNEHACRLYGVPMEKLTELTPADVSPEFQPDGRRSTESAREKMDQALTGGTLVFEWTHRQHNGRLVPTEVRLLRLPAKGENLLRASIIDNTERKQAEQALRDSEEKFRALFEGSIQGVMLQDETQFLEVNPAAVRIMRRKSAEELIGKNPSDTSPPFQPNGERSEILARKYVQECIANGSARFHWMCRSPNNEEIPLEVTLTRIQWSGRQVIQALITDITERKQSDQALREANENLRREIEQRTRAEESLKERIRTSTLSNEVALALNAATELQPMLQKCAELVVQHLEVAFARVWTLNDAAQMLELQASAGCYTNLDGPHSRIKVGELKLGHIVRERKPHLTNSVQTDPWVGDKDWAKREGMVAFAGYPLLLEDRVLGVLALFARRPLCPEILKALGAVADSIALAIDRKRAQKALAESEARFSVAFQASPIFIGIARMSDGRFELINDSFVTWSGYSREEILGRNTSELRVWDRQEEREAFWVELHRTGSIRSRECRFRNRTGKLFTMLLSSEVIQLNGVPHMLTLALDITQRKQAEEEMLKALGREKELSQLKSNFVSMVSHQFRTPLAIIQSSAELLREFMSRMNPTERDEQLESIAGNTRRMTGMMEEILVLSRLDAGKLDFRPTALDLSTFCRRVVNEVRSATNHECSIELLLARSLPACRADERLLEHIFTNLLTNAVKYSELGTSVHFEVRRESGDALCVIRDKGVGISDDDQKMLFTAFHRGANVENRPGTGLGLLLVKRCVELHHGKVQIESKLGEGTTVTVRLPVF